MGTNYYLKTNICEKCGRSDKIHIGKSSAGWCFALHVTESYEDPQIQSLDDWKKLWSQPGTKIENEYGEEVTPDQMLNIITNRSGKTDLPDKPEAFYSSWDQMLRENSAVWGPNNLLRHRKDAHPQHVGYGEGTWDLLSGEFS